MEIKIICEDCRTDLTPEKARLDKLVSYAEVRRMKFHLITIHKQDGKCHDR